MAQTFKIEMLESDFEIVKSKMLLFEKLFGKEFRIIGQKIIIEKNDPFAEWDGKGEPEEILEVEFRFSSSNHLWAMAKIVGKYELSKQTASV